jgi:predicted dehydrogenase
MTRLGVAVVGCGFQGAIHARNVASSERADLIACIDLDVTRSEELASATGAERAGDRLEDLWNDSDVDAVIIATTTNTHHQLALDAARSGKHMLLEKPMAMTVEECLEIEDACEDAGIVAVLGYKFRFTDAVLAARSAVPHPRVLSAQTLYDSALVSSDSWVNNRALSGGRLVSSLVHSVDLLRFLSGDDVVRVFAEGATAQGRPSSDPDTATATLQFENGAIGSIVHGTAAASGLLSTWSFQSADGAVNATIYDHGRRLTLHRFGEPDAIVVDPTEEPFEAGTSALFEAMVDAVGDRNVDVPGPRDGTLSLLISRCVEQAIATGQPVSVPGL